MKTEKLINAQQVAEMTGLAVKTILAGKAGTDEFTRIRIGKRKVAFSFSEVQEWINRLITQATGLKQQRREQYQKAVKRLSPPSRDEASRIVAAFRRG